MRKTLEYNKVNLSERLNKEITSVNVTEKNQPNITMMAKAFINLRKEAIK